jgi:hypothetical protein
MDLLRGRQGEAFRCLNPRIQTTGAYEGHMRRTVLVSRSILAPDIEVDTCGDVNMDSTRCR